MTESPKFKKKMDITVEQHHKAIATKLVSFVRWLEDKLGKEKAHEVFSDWAENESVESVRELIRKREEPIEAFEEVKVLMREWIRDINENNLEDVSITEETATSSTCMVDACIHAKVFRDIDAADIGYLLYCKHDFAAAPAIHPKVALKRTKTLMEGDEFCDFVYYWTESSE